MSAGTEIGLALGRAALGAMITYIHGWHKLKGAAAFLRTGAAWNFEQEVAGMGMPFPFPTAAAAAAAQFVFAPFLAVGLFTQLDAAVLGAVLLGAVAQNLLARRDPQLAILYAMCVGLFGFIGGGPYSLDSFWLARG